MSRAPERSTTIRLAEPSDFAAIAELTVRAYAALNDPKFPDYEHEVRDVAARAAACPVLVAVDDEERIVGSVTYVPGPGTPLSEGEREGEAGFRMLAVEPAAHGRGIGRALVAACIARARRDDRRGVTIYTRPSMHAAHGLYETLGFERDPGRDWEFEPGEWLLSYTLALR